jgi:hypothetical protein
MEPEYELALKVSSYADILWDRSDLQDAILDSNAPVSVQTILESKRIDRLFENLRANDALLRQAIDTASLYLPRKTWHISKVVDVVPTDEKEGPVRQVARRLRGNEKRADLIEITQVVLRSDFVRIVELLSGFETQLLPAVQPKSVGQEREQPTDENKPSFEAVRRALADFFYNNPDRAARVADCIDYFPSFTVQLARRTYATIGEISGWKPLESSWSQRVYDFRLRLEGRLRKVLSRADRRAVESASAAALRAMQAVQYVDVSEEWETRRRDPRDPFETFCWFLVAYRQVDNDETEPREILRSLSMLLLQNPLLGYFLAKAVGVPVPFGLAFGEELDEIASSRRRRGIVPIEQKPEQGRIWRDPYATGRGMDLSGICFSGGGIRSATFNLGVLQALADLRMLREFDYFSTVSGGGYIGAWLAAWTMRTGSIQAIEALIQRKRKLNPLGEDIHPIRWLREYSHYLTPQSGAITTDTLTLVAVYLRNVVLNQVLLLFVFAAMLLFPLLWFPVLGIVENSQSSLFVAVLLVLWFSFCIGFCLREFRPQTKPEPKDRRRYGARFIRGAIVFPAVAGSIVVAVVLWSGTLETKEFAAWALPLSRFFGRWPVTKWLTKSTSLMITFVVTAIGLLIAHWVGSWEPPKARPKSILYVLGVVPPAAVAGLCLESIRRLLQAWTMDTQAGAWTVLVLGPPLVLAAWSGTILTYLGVSGLAIGEERREWWARLGALIGAAAAAYLLLTSIAVYGPLLIWRSTSLNLSLASVWAVVTGLGLKLGSAGPEAPANGKTSVSTILKNAAMAVAPFVFIGGLFLFLSWGVFRLAALGHFGLAVDGDSLLNHYWQSMGELNQVRYLLFAACGASALLLGRTLGVNEFSMHNFYKNRLVRAYLAASRSRKQRQPNPFTGFDLDDDISLYRFQTNPPILPGDLMGDAAVNIPASSSIRPSRFSWPPKDEERTPSELQPSYVGPFLILNAALNVTKGQDLALQERKAESFTFTPLRCGFQYTRPRIGMLYQVAREFGYCRTESFAYERGPNIGAAMAISGAAANPNWGSNTRFGTAFLLTLFNLRLGWWIGNPTGNKSDRSSPRMGLIYLLYNLLGSASSESNYVNLSDGGHFDNSGLYELIRRRCRYIMICDAEQDAHFTFGALGSAIRKARVDFAAEVKIDVRNLIPVAGSNSKCHCAAGEVIYDDQSRGTVIYLKLSLDGGEPTDILEYKKRAPTFPHQTTADQFFSESQFESYRILGYYSALETWTAAWEEGAQTLPGAFRNFSGIWPEPSSVDTELRPHYDHVLSSHTWGNDTALTPAIAEQRLAMTHRLYHELRLSDQQNRAINHGIIRILRSWKAHPVQTSEWTQVGSTYEARFRRFYNNL